MRFTLRRFEPAKADGGTWSEFHRYRRLRHAQSAPDDPILPDDVVQASLSGNEGAAGSIAFAIFDDERRDRQVGELVYGFQPPGSPSYEENAANANVHLALLQDCRRQGAGRVSLQCVLQLMKAHDHQFALGSTSESDGRAFARAFGAEVLLRAQESRLALEDVDRSLLEAWVDAGRSRSPTSKIEVFEQLPEALLADYADVYTDTFNQQPMGEGGIGRLVFTASMLRKREADTRAMDGRIVTGVILEPGGAISGLSEVVVLASRPSLADQGLTGVVGSYRGASRGKWIKATIALELLRRFPKIRWVSTDNATTNAAMLRINDQMGFRPHRETTSLRLSRQALERALRS